MNRNWNKSKTSGRGWHSLFISFLMAFLWMPFCKCSIICTLVHSFRSMSDVHGIELICPLSVQLYLSLAANPSAPFPLPVFFSLFFVVGTDKRWGKRIKEGQSDHQIASIVELLCPDDAEGLQCKKKQRERKEGETRFAQLIGCQFFHSFASLLFSVSLTTVRPVNRSTFSWSRILAFTSLH